MCRDTKSCCGISPRYPIPPRSRCAARVPAPRSRGVFKQRRLLQPHSRPSSPSIPTSPSSCCHGHHHHLAPRTVRYPMHARYPDDAGCTAEWRGKGLQLYIRTAIRTYFFNPSVCVIPCFWHDPDGAPCAPRTAPRCRDHPRECFYGSPAAQAIEIDSTRHAGTTEMTNVTKHTKRHKNSQ